MQDQVLWQEGTIKIEAILSCLADETTCHLAGLLHTYQEEKKAIAAVVDQVDAGMICSRCGGICCDNGKYRISTLDMIAFRFITGGFPSANFDQRPVCPYGTATGCLLEPHLRPADCVLFICDQIHDILEEASNGTLTAQEQALRTTISTIENLLRTSLGQPFLLWAGKL